MSAKSAAELEEPLEPLPELLLPEVPPGPLPLPAAAGALAAISSPRARTPATNSTSTSPDLPFHFREIQIPFFAMR
ncbi:MAG: hypothetical protein M3317_01640 [Actinomycetota bacterium]|nr:hypothetical protein [Actinomycetota bacterium]